MVKKMKGIMQREKEMTKKNSHNAISNVADLDGIIVGCAGDFPHSKM